MKRKKPAGEVKLDISDNFQETVEGFKRSSYDVVSKMPPNSVDAIVANGVLEQTDGVARIQVMRLLHRALKPGGKLILNCAMWSSVSASMSPFSRWPPLSPESFGFYCADVRKRSKYNNPELDDIDFDLTWQEIYPEDWKAKNDITRQFAAKHYTNVVQGLAVTMTKKEVK